MKTIHHLFLILAAFLLTAEQTAEAQSFVDYSEHSFWSDSYPIYDAVNYRGKLYAIQNYEDAHARLVEFSVDPVAGTMKDERYWTVDYAGFGDKDKTNIKMVVYHDIIYLFKTSSSGNYMEWRISSFRLKPDNTAEIKDVPYPNNLAGMFNHEMRPGLGATVYKNKLCLFYISQQDDQLYMYSTDRPEDGSSWKRNATISQKIYHKNNLTEDTWDVCTWFGEANRKMTEKLVVGLIAGRNFWGYTFDGEPAASEPGKWTASHLLCGAPDFGAFNLKLVQGNIIGVGSNSMYMPFENPLQFIYAYRKNFVTDGIHQRQILTHEFFPARQVFGDAGFAMYTNLPYGYFGAALVSKPFNTKKYRNDDDLGRVTIQDHQQFICILRGACDSHFNRDSHYAIIKSNRTQVESCSVPASDIIKDPALRPLCTLTGIIEGPPPSVIDNYEMYENVLPGNSDYITSFTFAKGEENLYSEENATGFGINAGLGPDLDIFTAQLVGGYEMQQSMGNEKTYSKSYSTTFYNKDTLTAKRGYYLYTVPSLERYTHTYYDPQGSSMNTSRPQLVTFLQTGMSDQSVSYRLDDPDIDSELRIADPLKLEEWQKRNKLFRTTSYKNILFESLFNPMAGTSGSVQETVSNTNNYSSSFKLGLDIKTPAFKMDGNYNMGYTSSTRSTVSRGASFELLPLSNRFTQYYERPIPVMNYALQGYFLNDPTDDVTARYYADLKRRGIMVEGEKPFILAWNVPSISFGYQLAGETPTANEAATPGGARITDEGDALVIHCPAGQRVQVYGIDGRPQADKTAAGSETRVRLAPGLYVVRISGEGQVRTYKAAKR